MVVLNSLVATSTDLAAQCKMAHWNTRGPSFYARHELFDEASDQVRQWTDMFAERAGVLGGYAMGTVRFAATESELPDYENTAVTGQDHIKALILRFAMFCASLRGALARVTEVDDPATEELVVSTLRAAEKMMWTLDSHLLPEPVGVSPRRNQVRFMAEAARRRPTDPEIPEVSIPAVDSMTL